MFVPDTDVVADSLAIVGSLHVQFTFLKVALSGFIVAFKVMVSDSSIVSFDLSRVTEVTRTGIVFIRSASAADLLPTSFPATSKMIA